MKISLCTISFRHQLIGLKDIAFWARDNGFQGIELWGVHARNQSPLAIHNAQWMAAQGLSVPMISDYLPLHDADLLRSRTLALCAQARTWGAGKMRTFAGQQSSAEATPDERRQTTRALREACTIAADHGLRLLIETHPGTLADTLTATCGLIDATDHDALAINFDALHVWEGGDDPVEARRILLPRIAHYHLKNVSARDRLGVFAPANVYSAAGSRDGMVPLFEGAYDYSALLAELARDPACEASLEWFGDAVFQTLKSDIAQIRARTQSDMPETAEAV
ncbi:sugar phosphate isomerase/epimerase family protein [Leisingera sp. McT4-56]|uniref:sugar phosphate isomerase/epimerase family protein n=1 Tax=Leisingera sp. McT4-56 TaxID=2881255 RepID=UPI001CF843E7|nr:sugar phosphate isomerase/epimerase family protein [Leisingera sp. McT4-56]MCB4456829.1 sugar phosphate isomerase/epimerase [Leisingera sp. McT4-56]